MKIHESLKSINLDNLSDLRLYENYFGDEKVYIKLYTNGLYIRELENALRQGKTCTEYQLTEGFGNDFTINWLNWMYENKFTLLDLLAALRADDLPPLPGKMELNRKERQAIRIFSPFANIKPIKQPTKWTLPHIWKAILSGQISDGKCTGYYTDDYAHDAAVNYKQGSISVLSLAKDIIESPSGWWVGTPKETDEHLEMSVCCHHFNNNKVYFNKNFKPGKEKSEQKETVPADTEKVLQLQGTATKKQLWALHCITKKDTRSWNISKQEASEMIKRLNAGETQEEVLKQYAI